VKCGFAQDYMFVFLKFNSKKGYNKPTRR